MEDIVGDYKDKTVTLEDFPFFDMSQSIKMASVHPCKHASVMKVLLDRADAALKLRREKGAGAKVGMGMEGLVDETRGLAIAEKEKAFKAGVSAAGGNGGDEWEVLQEGNAEEDDSAIRVDQYLVVFLVSFPDIAVVTGLSQMTNNLLQKFMASVTPTIEHDFTMGV